jgi:bacteriocin-like protein
MNNETRFDSLTDDELEQVIGGSCKTALVAASVYSSLASFYGGLGMSSASAAYAGRAIGVLEGGC